MGYVFVVESQLVTQDVDIMTDRLGRHSVLDFIDIVIILLVKSVLMIQLARHLYQLLGVVSLC